MKVEVISDDQIKGVYDVKDFLNGVKLADAMFEATEMTVNVIEDGDVVYERKTPKNSFLELAKEKQEEKLMLTAMRIMDLYTGLYTDFTDYMLMLSDFIDWAREFEYTYFGSSEYETEFLSLTERVFTAKLKGKYGSERTAEPQMYSGWIPAKKKPKKKENYLVCFDDGFVSTAYYGEDWELWADSWDVIAWMPLPKAYRREK